MRSYTMGVFIFMSLCAVPGWGRQSSSSQPSQPQSPAPQDPQAVSVLNQALSVAGGSPALAAISDYTAAGSVTYHWSQDTQGTVTVKGMGVADLRIDATLPSGMRSESIRAGQYTVKSPVGAVSQLPPSYTVPSSDAFPYKTPLVPSSLVLPDLQIIAVLANPRISLSYKGLTQIDGLSVHQIEAARYSPTGRIDAMTEYSVWDFFVDASTMQLIMVRDIVFAHVIHEIHYSSYQSVNGVLVPFSVSEQLGGQHTWDIQLTQFIFNSGLQDVSVT